MIYVEWLRARKRLMIFSIVLAVLAIFVILLGQFGHVVGRLDAAGNPHGSVGWTVGWSTQTGAQTMPGRTFLHNELQRATLPLDAFLAFATLIAFIFCIGVYTSLHAQKDSLHLAFTKPLSRTRLALGFFAVDLASIAAIYVVAAILALLPIAVFGGLNRVIAPHPFVIVGLGGILLLYGWMQASTAWLRRGAGAVIAALWIAFGFVPSLTRTPFPQLNAPAGALWLLDPLRYLGVNASGNPSTWSPDAGTFGPAIALAWGLGVVACAIAVVIWNRVEV